MKGESNEQLILCCWLDDFILASSRGIFEVRIWFDQNLRKELQVSPWTPGVEAGSILNMKVLKLRPTQVRR